MYPAVFSHCTVRSIRRCEPSGKMGYLNGCQSWIFVLFPFLLAVFTVKNYFLNGHSGIFLPYNKILINLGV
jgi:hypothetical protein